MEQLETAVRRHDKLLLSGGVDSSILGFLMSRSRGRIQTFTFGAEPQDPWSDGPIRARPVAQALGSEHAEYLVGPDQYLSDLDGYLSRLGEPALSSYLAYLVAKRLSGTGAWVFGMGADEIFLGDPWYGKYQRARRALQILRGVPRPLRAAAVRLLRPGVGRVAGLSKKLELVACRDPDFRFLYAFARDNLDVGERLALLAPEYRPPGFSRDDANFAHGDPEGDGLEGIQEMLLVHEFPDGHGLDLAHFHRDLNLELPFFSPPVVAAALAVDPETRAAGHKNFLREAARDVVPPQHLLAPKGSFVMPAVTWLRGPLAPLLRDRLSQARLSRRGIWNVSEITARLDAFLAGRGSPFDVIRVLHLELWMEHHGVTS